MRFLIKLSPKSGIEIGCRVRCKEFLVLRTRCRVTQARSHLLPETKVLDYLVPHKEGGGGHTQRKLWPVRRHLGDLPTRSFHPLRCRVKRLHNMFDSVCFTVHVTPRPPRSSNMPGRKYQFVCIFFIIGTVFRVEV